MKQMVKLFDKNKHRDQFRLRLLVTNSCDLACTYCLNDFQRRGNDFVNISDALHAVEVYKEICDINAILEPTVTFSGGEPGLFNGLGELLKLSKKIGVRTVVNTNGLAYRILNSKQREYVDSWHIGGHLLSEYNKK
ncbi:unnamed protein product [marine sediment metagenome]|uniref:Radical SAM core domain-containing protein n=1 Tax=marine sediment metagenome TaxID=412755 RepID=X1TNJ6_9ZZZZ